MLTEFESFDFTQMRADEGRATYQALEQFHQIFKNFFDQYSDSQLITEHVMQTYLARMVDITDIINKAEYSYFLAKYHTQYGDETPAIRQSMAETTKLKSYKEIPARMKYWAAAARLGDPIRYPEEHLKTVHRLEVWNRLIEAEQAQQTLASNRSWFR